MERAQSLPSRGSDWNGNPFYSQKAQDECVLQASRPQGLPTDQMSDDVGPPLPSLSGRAAQFEQVSTEQTGKGRGGSSAGLLYESRPTVEGRGGARTEGLMPPDDGRQTMGSVSNTQMEGKLNGDELQRALEGELVAFLREQNSKLMNDVEFLKGKLELLSAGKADSGMETSPWSTIGGVPSSRSSNDVGIPQKDRPRRNGSQTPRSKVREVAVSPEKRHEHVRFTPNGTQVPSGPPPSQLEDMPPVPPFPVCHGEPSDGRDLQNSFVSNLYDTCESKVKVKNGDVNWKPQNERNEGTDILTASEAKQIWLEREVQSLKTALDRVSIPLAFQQSEFWNAGFDSRGKVDPKGHHSAAEANCTSLGLHGGSGTGDLPHRAVHGGVAGSHQSMVFGGWGELDLQRRAAYLHGEHRDHDRAFHMHGAQAGQARAFDLHGEHPGRGRALHGVGNEWDLHDKGPAHPCLLPGHDVRGGGMGDGSKFGSPVQSWPVDSQAGHMNNKGELPDLPANSTPLQFGDWLHLIAPVMKDISGIAGWWWEATLREAKVYYEGWKNSTPLQRIQIEPRLPDALQEHKFQRTEQRGIQMLLKAIPEAEQQALVTERALSTTAILYKLLVRFQPGGAGEKQLLLSQLTSLPATKSIHDLAAAIRNWRRHFGRAQEVQAVLPDGVLLLKALDGPIQHLASLDPQAAFRLAQSRMQLQLDEKPVHENLWAFSQCLLAEAETLCLLTTAPATTVQSPLKMKQLQGDQKTSSSTTPDNKPKPGATIDKPCKYFVSGQGCRAGKTCKWSHSWDGVEDKSSRCWICGGKDHIKSDCRLKAVNKKQGEPSGGSGGGRGSTGAGASNATSTLTSSTSTSKPSAPGGKAGAAAVKVAKSSEEGATATTSEGGLNVPVPPEVTSSTTSGDKDGGRSGGSSNENASGTKTAELLHEATQLLKTLRISDNNPKLKVMQLSGIDQADEAVVLIDSGATHALRPAEDWDEWNKAEGTTVMLAEGSTTRFRLKPGTKMLLSEPGQRPAWIIPMGGLAELDFVLRWSGNQCSLQDDEGRHIDVQVQNGCPMVSLEDGRRLLQWLELYHVYQKRKLMMVRTLLTDESAIDKSRINLDMALTAMMRQQFPNLPDEVMMKLIPDLEMIKTEDFGSRLPWNRHKRRRLMKAKHVILHLFSGPDQAFWDKQCASASTEVLCIDTTLSTAANLHDRNVYGFLLMLCASGRVRAILGALHAGHCQR